MKTVCFTFSGRQLFLVTAPARKSLSPLSLAGLANFLDLKFLEADYADVQK